MKKEKKRMNIERWCAESALYSPPQAFICPKGACLRHSVFLVLHSIFPPKAALFPGEIMEKA
jgi:hypothetical protein